MRGKIEKGGDERGGSSATTTLTHTPNPIKLSLQKQYAQTHHTMSISYLLSFS